MEGNAGQVNYIGGRQVRVPRLTTTGLGDYDRAGGKYPKGAVNLDWQLLELTQDRGGEFYFDRNDVDESGFHVTAQNTLSEFQRMHVVPEIDAYRYSTIAGLVPTTTDTIDRTNIYAKFLSQIRAMQNKTGMGTAGLVATMSWLTYGILEQSEEFSRTVSIQSFAQGDVSFEVKTINGVPIIPVQEAVFKTAYEFKPGTTTDAMGFVPAPGAKNINWLIMPRTAPIAISKTDVPKIFSPDVNQDGDGWKLQYRKYHDLWLKENQIPSIIASVAA